MEDLLDQELQNAGKLSVEDVVKELEQTEKGQPRQSIQNSVTVLQKDPVLAGSIRRNELTDKTEIVKDVGWKRRGEAITDTDVNQIRLYLENQYGLTREKQIRAALDIVSSENSFHPIRDYLNTLEWDGVERIRHLLPKYLIVRRIKRASILHFIRCSLAGFVDRRRTLYDAVPADHP